MQFFKSITNFVTQTLTTNPITLLYRLSRNSYQNHKRARSITSIWATTIAGGSGAFIFLFEPTINNYLISGVESLFHTGAFISNILAGTIGFMAAGSLGHNVTKAFYREYAKRAFNDPNTALAISKKIVDTIYKANQHYFDHFIAEGHYAISKDVILTGLKDSLLEIRKRYRESKGDPNVNRQELKYVLYRALRCKDLNPLFKYYAKSIAGARTEITLLQMIKRHIIQNTNLPSTLLLSSSDSSSLSDVNSESEDYSSYLLPQKESEQLIDTHHSYPSVLSLLYGSDEGSEDDVFYSYSNEPELSETNECVDHQKVRGLYTDRPASNDQDPLPYSQTLTENNVYTNLYQLLPKAPTSKCAGIMRMPTDSELDDMAKQDLIPVIDSKTSKLYATIDTEINNLPAISTPAMFLNKLR